jgi:anti-sigma B factor antagonist
MELYTRDNENVRIISIEGAVSYFEDEYFCDYVNKRVDSGKDVILDCSKLTYLNSTGFGSLLVLYKKQKNNNRKLALYQVNPDVYSLFETTKLTSILEIYDNEEEALRHISC